MWGRILLGIGLVGVCLLLAACAGFVAPIHLLFDLTLGWALYFAQLVPSVRPNLVAILWGFCCLIMLGFGGHAFLRWLHGQMAAASDQANPPPKPWPLRLTLALLALVIFMFVAGISAVGVAHQTAWLVTSSDPIIDREHSLRYISARIYSEQNMRDLVMALRKYSEEDPERRLPSAAITNPEGQPVLSWRVALLPYLGEKELLKEFRLAEPWDSPHNLRLLPRMPKIYASPLYPGRESDPIRTHYRVFTGVGTAFEGGRGLRLEDDFPDGLMNTIFVIEAKESVPWTKPDELPYDAEGPLPAFGFSSTNTFAAAMGDGSIGRFAIDADDSDIRPAITRNAGDSFRRR
jgi:hypothetical protein